MRIEDVRVGMRVRRVEPSAIFNRDITYVVSKVRAMTFNIEGYGDYGCSPSYWALAEPIKKPLSGFGRFVKVQREKDAHAPL